MMDTKRMVMNWTKGALACAGCCDVLTSDVENAFNSKGRSLTWVPPGI